MSVLQQLYPATSDDPRELAVYDDKVVYGNFIVSCPSEHTFEDATVFGPGYKGIRNESMTIWCRNATGKVKEIHVEIV
jgi:hypothetical protein